MDVRSHNSLRRLIREELTQERDKVLEQLGVALDALNAVQGLVLHRTDGSEESMIVLRSVREARGPLQTAWETVRRIR